MCLSLLFQRHVRGWYRFIDDILFFWVGPADLCQEFLQTLNQNNLRISLTSKVSSEVVEFLDLKVRIQNGKIHTSLYRKETATNSLLHFSSFHPHHLRKGIPKGQFLRLRRNCSEPQDFREAAADLTQRFRARHYPRKIISEAFETSRQSKREELLAPKPRIGNTQIRLITKYNNQWSELYRVLKSSWHILLSDSKLANYVPNNPQMVARRAPNIKDKLVQSHFQVSTNNRVPCSKYT